MPRAKGPDRVRRLVQEIDRFKREQVDLYRRTVGLARERKESELWYTYEHERSEQYLDRIDELNLLIVDYIHCINDMMRVMEADLPPGTRPMETRAYDEARKLLARTSLWRVARKDRSRSP